MKVLHVVTLHTPTNAFGGPTRVALNLARGLRGRGVDAELVTLGDGFPEGALPDEVEGVPARIFRARHVLPRFEVSGITSPSLLAGARRLVRSADVVHVHLMRDLITLPVAVAALQCGRPLVLQTHGMVDPSDKPLAKVLDALATKRLLRRADAVLHLTEWERTDLEAVVGEGNLARPVRLPNGTALHQPRVRSGPPTVLYLARFQTRKRPKAFAEAIPEVLRHYPDARFVLAGPDSGELAGTLETVRTLGVEKSVRHVGPLSHAEALEAFRAADVYVLPSVDEPFAMSLLESMSVGTPVVVRESNGLAPDIERSGAGRVVRRPEDVGKAVLELLDDEANQTASQAAWRLIRDELSLDAVLDVLQGVYETATRERSPASSPRSASGRS
ncbi:glycosyltransferase [Actinacidiphila glaucinigra]|uniref:glycosyltransferase n=1 Tax=Actinacidiphila glaucinigra TaxID=235986 RepID=UPI002DDBAD53|nr:glycosyltransferase [Actinacidiphila glaucinigra]WSD62421.1 glycosyltransferase [Actinacidiphila glaucinigra]